VLGQLASLSALAQQTAHAFPDLDDLNSPDEHSDDDSDDGFGDQTVLMPAGGPAAGPPSKPQPNPVDTESGAEQVEPGPVTSVPEDVAVDGDTTVLVAPGDLPAGTAHLSQGRNQQ